MYYILYNLPQITLQQDPITKYINMSELKHIITYIWSGKKYRSMITLSSSEVFLPNNLNKTRFSELFNFRILVKGSWTSFCFTLSICKIYSCEERKIHCSVLICMKYLFLVKMMYVYMNTFIHYASVQTDVCISIYLQIQENYVYVVFVSVGERWQGVSGLQGQKW